MVILSPGRTSPAGVSHVAHSVGRDVDSDARRALRTLIAAQVIGGMGLASSVTVGALIAADLLAAPALVGLPFAASVAGTTAVALPLFVYMRRSGRRPALRLAWLVGALGALAVFASTGWRSTPLLLIGMVLYGCANAASDAARYAASDLAVRRGRAMGGVVFASALTAIIGPNLLGPADHIAVGWNLPAHAGPFLLSALTFTGAAFVLDRRLRPDPLVIRERLAALEKPEDSEAVQQSASSLGSRARTVGGSGTVSLGLFAMTAVNFAMVGAMTGTPADLDRAGHDLSLIGVVVSLHIAAMYAPSPLTGWLADRIGPGAVVALAAVITAVAGLVIAASSTSGHVEHATTEVGIVTTGLVLLGVGWNFGYIGGSALLGGESGSVFVQGVGELLRGTAALIGALLAGPALTWAGLPGIGIAISATGFTLLLVSVSIRVLKQRRGLPRKAMSRPRLPTSGCGQ
jgi:MFS family permease